MKTELEEKVSRVNVSYIVYESATARLDRIIKRLWIIILVLIILLVGSNVAWLYYESQYEQVTETTTQTIEQKADGDSNNSFIGGDNNVGETDGQNSED